MAGRLLALGAKFKTRLVPSGTACYHYEVATKEVVGNRELVGHGVNGNPAYADRPDYPMPSLRWKENSNEVIALREKEKGDWHKLTIEEKKQLYRNSFCQTFAEFTASSGEWKSITAGILVVISIALWFSIGVRVFVHPPLPKSASDESRRAQLRRMIDMRAGAITGVSSTWDYEKDDWKK